MEQIATGVGIKKSSLYTFISSKEGLYWDIFEDVERHYRELTERLFAASEGMTADKRLKYLFREHIVNVCCCPEIGDEGLFLRRALLFPPSFLKEKLLTKALENEMKLGEKLEEIVRDGMRQGLIREGTPKEMLLSYYSLRHGLAGLMKMFMGELPEDEKLVKIDIVWQDYWQGIKGG